MAVCTMMYLTYLRAGEHLIVFRDTYGANHKVALILEHLGVKITWMDADKIGDIEKEVMPETRMVFVETPSNPLCKVIDIHSPYLLDRGLKTFDIRAQAAEYL